MLLYLFVDWCFTLLCFEANFLRSNYLQVLDLLIFRQIQPGHWGRGCLPFSPNFECYLVCHFHLAYIEGNKTKTPQGAAALVS